MPDLQIVIPYLSMPWSLHDCIESMGESDIPILVVDNSPNSDTKQLDQGNQLDMFKNIEYVYYPQNYGVPGSWNLGIIKGASCTLICSTSVRFSRPIKDIAQLIVERAADTMCIFEGYHLVAISKKLVERIGYFDENFYPGYNEDADYGRRLDLINVHPESYYDLGNTSIGSGLQKRSGNWYWDKINVGRMESYLYHKWGGPPYQYATPFGNPDYPLSYWPKVHH